MGTGIGVISPEDLARAQAYYGGQPGVNMSPIDAPPPPATPPPPAPTGTESLLRDLAGALTPAPALPPEMGPEAPPTPAAPAPSLLGKVGSFLKNPGDAMGLPPAPELQQRMDAANAPPAAPADAPKTIAPVTITGQRPSGGGGGGGNPDPYGVKADQKALLGTYDTEKAAVGEQGHLEASKALHLGDEMGRAAREKQEDAAMMHAEAQEKNRLFDQHIEETQRQLDEVREKKIEPFRLLDDSGSKVMTIIGGVLGGAYMGLNHMDHNPFLDDLNKRLDRDMAGQSENIANQKEALQGRMTLLGAMRDKFKDETLAKLQARNLAYEGVKEQIQAEAAQYDSPIIQSRADQAANAVDRVQKGMKTDIDKAAAASAAAAAGAAVAQARADRKESNERLDKLYTYGLGEASKLGMAGPEADRFARHIVATAMAPGGAAPYQAPASTSGVDPIQAVPKDQRPQAQKEQEEYAKATSGLSAIKKTFRAWDTTSALDNRQVESLQATIAGAYKNALGPGMSSDKDFDTFIRPNIPKEGDNDADKARKFGNIEATIMGKVATPTLDRHSPGWNSTTPKGPQRYDLQGKPIP